MGSSELGRSTCALAIRALPGLGEPIELSGDGPGSAIHRPNQVASPGAALSTLPEHRFGWINVSNLPSSSGDRPCPSKSDQTSAQRLVQIHDQVVGILDPDRNANKRRRDTQPQPFLFRDVRMGHRRRMRSKRLRTTQTHRELDHLEAIEDGKASASPPFTAKLKVEPGLLHWRSKTGRSGWSSGKKPRYQTDVIFG